MAFGVGIKGLTFAAMIIASGSLTACASSEGMDQVDDPYAIYDPFEEFNRDMLKFNVAVLELVANPPSRSKEHAAQQARARAEAGLPPIETKEEARSDDGSVGVFDIFGHILGLIGNVGRYFIEPLYLVNAILQGNGDKAYDTFSRILINGALGFGAIDVAEGLGIVARPADFAQTMAIWGIPEGPFVMLPFVGARTTLDLVGAFAESRVSVIDHLEGLNNESRWALKIGGSLFRSSQREQNDTSLGGIVEALRTVDDTSIDPYATIRAAYIQQRRASYATQEDSAESLPDIDDLFGDEIGDDTVFDDPQQ